MSDQFDRASDLEQKHLDAALQAQKNRAAGNGINAGATWMDSARECRVCDEPIPTKRRKAIPGVNTCIDCQADLEYALKGIARPHL
jgi:phage/conjugal plasmid C-4 type zinc finger TraR family protein